MNDEKNFSDETEATETLNEDTAGNGITEKLAESGAQTAVIIDAEPDLTDDAAEPEQDTDTSLIEDDGSVKPKKIKIIIAILVALAVAVIVLAIIFLPKLFFKNKYEKYIDVTGRTIGQIAKEQGYDDFKEFLDKWKLPADMPENTSEASAYNAIPFGVIIEMNMYEDMETVEDAKKLLELPDWVTEDTPWGEATGEAPLGAYIGKKNLDSFKSAYGLGNDVTDDTLYKEIRDRVDNIDKQKREETEKHAQSAREDSQEQDEVKQPEDEAQEQNTGETQEPAQSETQAE